MVEDMKFKKLFFIVSVLVLISSCKETTSYYNIPLEDKKLAICIPAFSDYAYVYVGTHKLYTATDSFDLKIHRGETTDVSLILSKQKSDTIYYSDRWNDVFVIQTRKYKRIKWHDNRFYIKKSGKYYINPDYIEVVIKDYATFVVCQTNNSYKILEPLKN